MQNASGRERETETERARAKKKKLMAVGIYIGRHLSVTFMGTFSTSLKRQVINLLTHSNRLAGKAKSKLAAKQSFCQVSGPERGLKAWLPVGLNAIRKFPFPSHGVRATVRGTAAAG